MRRVQKPIRLYVLTIFIVVAYGIMPFISAMPFGQGFALFGPPWALPLNGSFWILFGSEDSPAFIVVLISLALCVFSAASAVWAFYGDKEGRTSVLVFVTLDVLWWTGLVLNAVLGNQFAPESIPLIVEPLIPMGWLAFIWWNFTRADINAFYAYQSSLGR